MERSGSDPYKKALKEPALSKRFWPKEPRYEIVSREGGILPAVPVCASVCERQKKQKSA